VLEANKAGSVLLARIKPKLGESFDEEMLGARLGSKRVRTAEERLRLTRGEEKGTPR
jgi:hypothetical protein